MTLELRVRATKTASYTKCRIKMHTSDREAIRPPSNSTQMWESRTLRMFWTEYSPISVTWTVDVEEVLNYIKKKIVAALI